MKEKDDLGSKALHKEKSLKNKYSAGSQMWFSEENTFDKNLRRSGCGVIALHDLAVYKGYIKPTKEREDYMEQVRKMKRGGMYIVPGLGIAPYYYPLLCDLYLIRHGVRLRVGWGHTARNQLRKKAADIKALLDKDYPVIFTAGPRIPFLFKDKVIPMYSQDLKPTKQTVKSHYMTVVGVIEDGDEIWIKAASWGYIYCMKLKDMVSYSKYAYPLTTRFYNIYEKKGRKSHGS